MYSETLDAPSSAMPLVNSAAYSVKALSRPAVFQLPFPSIALYCSLGATELLMEAKTSRTSQSSFAPIASGTIFAARSLAHAAMNSFKVFGSSIPFAARIVSFTHRVPGKTMPSGNP